MFYHINLSIVLKKTFPAINHLKSTSFVHYYQLFMCKHLLSFGIEAIPIK